MIHKNLTTTKLLLLLIVSPSILATLNLNTLPSFPFSKPRQCDSSIFRELTEKLGYPVAEYDVITEDGYILKIFRIQKKNTQIIPGLKPIFLQHGLFDSADAWAINDEDKAPGLVLANKGYDVWLGNSRGNKYSLRHQKIKTSSMKFWEYSFQEMGKFDIPANLDFISKKTGFEKIVYIGHSQGTSQLVAALSDPHSSNYVNSMLEKAILLGPVVYLSNPSNYFFSEFAKNSRIIAVLVHAFRMKELLPGQCSATSATARFNYALCHFVPEMCDLVLYFIEANPKYENMEKVAVYAEHLPSGSSWRTLDHFQQLIEAKRSHPVFRMYNYGAKLNKKIYGQRKAPDYDFGNIRTPIRLFMGVQDSMGDIIDNNFFIADLQRLGKDYKSYVYNDCGHFTFTVGKDTERFLRDILREIEE